MKNKNIYFHIGPGKTGTSAIQAWLQNNQTWLESAGIMYPPHPLDENEVSSGNLLEIIERDAEGEGHLCLDKCQKLIDKFNNSDAHTLLLSSEWFFIRVESILECDLFKDAKIIAYLRDPIELIESNYNQSVKRHGVFLPLTPVYRGFPSLNVLRKLVRTYGRERVILRPYHNELFHDGNIITDILHSVGVEKLPEVEKKRINSSYQYEALEFKRLLNNFPIDSIQAKIDRLLQQYSGGTANYTLLDHDFEVSSRQSMNADLVLFKEQLGIDHLDDFIEQIKVTSEKHKLEQQSASASQLANVAHFIAINDKKLFTKMCQILEENQDFYLDTPEFWHWFNERSKGSSQPIATKETKSSWKTRLFPKTKMKEDAIPHVSETACADKDEVDIRKLQRSVANFKKRLNLPPHMKDERVLITLALFATEQEDYHYAEKLYLQVLALDSKNIRALTNINALKIKIRQLN
ncbi:hypothetical protein [Vibrio parahaemolyticus]|uniref:hypothetical protein n=1 Tax=Vibrio parahaemolyticus TaxID=670 RepID=UPI003AAA52D0